MQHQCKRSSCACLASFFGLMQQECTSWKRWSIFQIMFFFIIIFFHVSRKESMRFIFWLPEWENTDPENTPIIFSGLEKVMPVLQNSFNFPRSSHFSSHHFWYRLSDSDLTQCKFAIPQFLYLHPVSEEMHRAVIQNLCAVSLRKRNLKENKYQGKQKQRLGKISLGNWDLGQLRLSYVQVLKKIPLMVW